MRALVLVLTAAAAVTGFAGFEIDGRIPAGNIVVEAVEGDTVRLTRELRDTATDWFYWAFRVKGAKGRTLTFRFDENVCWGGPVGVRGPAVTTDGGRTWSYPCDGKSTKSSFAYTFGTDDEVRFYETWQYLPPDWEAFLAVHAADRGKKFETGALCRSRKGRDVPKARFGCLSGRPKYRIFMSSRHHCSEATATPVLEGVASAFLADDELGRWLCENVELMVVPFVDYDGVMDGDQGKYRAPHDHNRDYTEFVYPETRAIRDWILGQAGGRLDVFIDVHCPWIRNGKPNDTNEHLYTPWKDPEILPSAANEERFSELLEKLQCGSMRYKASDDLRYGQGWNTGGNYAQGWSAVIWACKTVKGLRIARSLEVPFANANGAVVTPETCRELGRDTAKVFRAMLDSQWCDGAAARDATAIDFTATDGRVKPVNGVGQPPMLGLPVEAKMFHYLKEAGIPYSRLHDVGGWQGQHRYVDIPNVFPDFDADENDPKNYMFDYTDILIKNLVENGVEPFYRLGVSIENPWEWGLKIGTNERIVPPKDFAKWARICEHVIRHYTEGWANGFRYKMDYWEIWNEPDNREDPSISPLWQAPFSEYIRFYGVVATYLKEKFPHLKIGGFGCCGFYDAVGADAVGAAHSSPRTVHFVQCAKDFLAAAKEHGWPVDFFSYHSYSDAPDALRQVAYADQLLNEYGFTPDRTERIFNEWLPAVSHENLGTAKQAAQIAAELIGLQNGPCDVACIYDGRCGVGNYSPLFNPMTYKPHKAYYVFKAFNELRKLGTAVKPPVTPDGIYAAVATDGTNACVLVANISGKTWRPGFDFGGWRVDSVRVIDTKETYAVTTLPAEFGNDSVWLIRCKKGGAGSRILESVRAAHRRGGGTVELADGEYHFYSSSATNMRFHVSNHDQPDVRPVFLPFVGITNVAVVAKNAKFVMHGMGTAILVRDSLGVSFKGITIEWERPFFAKAEIVGFENGRTRVRFPARDKVVVEDGKLMLCGEDWKVNLRDGNVFDRTTHEMVERTADVRFSGKGEPAPVREDADGTVKEFLIDVDLSKIGAGAKVGDVYVMRNGYRPHPIVCLDRAKDTVFENFVFRDGFGMGILAQLSENVTLRGGGCYPRDCSEYNSNTIDATHFSNCRGTVTVENCRFEGMMDDALNVHSTSMGIVAKPSANSIRCRYMHPQAIGFGVFAPGDAIRFIAGKTLENGFVGKVRSVETHDEREITLTLEEDVPSEYGVGDAVENADWQCSVVFRNNTVANNRARGVLFTTPHRIVCEGNFFDHVSGSAILFAGDAQGWYESGACEDVVIRKNRFRDCLTSVFQYCDGLMSIHPEVKDIEAQKRRYHRNIVIEDNDIETFDVPLLYALGAEDIIWRNNRVTKHDRYRSWGKPEVIKIACGRVEWQWELESADTSSSRSSRLWRRDTRIRKERCLPPVDL